MRRNIARITAEGAVDPDWNPGAIGYVYALVLSGDTLYAGGSFQQIDDQPRDCIAALDATTGKATAWNPGANGDVYALALSGHTVYVGGRFTQIGGKARTRIAALAAAGGAATAWDPGADNNVNALAIRGNEVYAGGDFTTIAGQPRDRVAAFKLADGGLTAWDPGADGGVRALAVGDDTVYAGGDFSVIGGEDRNRIAALDADDGAADPAWDPGADDSVHALAVSGNRVYAGGKFTTIGGQDRTSIAALDAASGEVIDWNPGADGSVGSLAVSGDMLHVGGEFSLIAGQPRGGYARFRLFPTTTIHGLPSREWTNKPVKLTFSVAHGGGPEIERTEYSLDGGGWTTVLGGGLKISADGEHVLQYRSVDKAGDVEEAKIAWVKIDKVKPRTAAPKQATAKRGAKATLRYRVTDPKPNSGRAVVVIKVKNARGKLVKTLKLGRRPVKSALQSAAFTVPKKWPRGTYRFYVSATDLAGNKQVKIKSNKLLVR